MSRKKKALRPIINKYLDQLNYDKLHKILEGELAKYNSLSHHNVIFLCEIAGGFVDLGTESSNALIIKSGIKLFEDNKEIFEGKTGELNFHFNLANGYSSLHTISLKTSKQYLLKPKHINGYFLKAKQHYLKAFKQIDVYNLNDFGHAILTNLGLNFTHSGRIIESLQLFDTVLRSKPDLVNALVCKASGLLHLNDIPGAKSMSLYAEAYHLFSDALNTGGHFPPGGKQRITAGIKFCEQALTEYNFNLKDLDKERKLSEEEFKNHPPEVRFYIGNYLSLSEHALFCGCNGALTDNLMIGYDELLIEPKFAHLEQLLNQLKSEFSLARRLLYDYTTIKAGDNMDYHRFGQEGILYGLRIEKLRMAFRLSFGIFDKIAKGLFYLFDFPKGQTESVYFETFWNKKNVGRWNAINAVDNIHLTALYCIACDLIKKEGEFGFYKTWRNQLEHGAFSVILSDKDKSSLSENSLFTISTDLADFEYKTMHLLHLVRAAIFSFTFCAKLEATKSESKITEHGGKIKIIK